MVRKNLYNLQAVLIWGYESIGICEDPDQFTAQINQTTVFTLISAHS